MRYIQADGAPAATPRPASHPRTFRRVTGKGRDHDWREQVGDIEGLYGVAETRIDKPARTLKPGDSLVFALGGRLVAVRVEQLGERRGPAEEARTLYVALQDSSPGDEQTAD